MRYFVICLFVLFTWAMHADEIQLKNKLAQARPGSFLVVEQNKIFTFLHIRDCKAPTIEIEEVSIPTASYARRPMPWQTWFECGAPGHTAWLISRVNVDTGRFEATYSCMHRGWIDLSDSNPFLTTLLNLRFQEVPEEERRRIGLPPGRNKVDRRPLWSPRLIVNGRQVTNIPFHSYKARWPSDGSELARKWVEIYLPAPSPDDTSWYPAYFPYWIEVEGKIGNAKARVVDSGLEAQSPAPWIDYNSPQRTFESFL
jgi:hypothetical protein